MRSHKNSRELHIGFPGVRHLFGGEALKVYECQIHKSLYKCEIPTIAAKSIKNSHINKGKKKLRNSNIKIEALLNTTECNKIMNLNLRRLYTYS